MRDELELILLFYCHSRSVGYKQGLLEVAAPIFICLKQSGYSNGIIYNAFYALINKFLPSIFNDQAFQSLR